MNRTRYGHRRRFRRRVAFSKLFCEAIGYTTENGEIFQASQTIKGCNKFEVQTEQRRKVTRQEAKTTSSSDRASNPHIKNLTCKSTGKVTCSKLRYRAYFFCVNRTSQPIGCVVIVHMQST